MINSFSDLELDDIDNISAVDIKIKEKLGLSFNDMCIKLEEVIKLKAEELAEDLPSIAPYKDYSKMIEDKNVIVEFIKNEVSKPENWEIKYIMPSDVNSQLIEFVFNSKALDDEDFKGFVFVSKSGKIRHAFVQPES